MLVHYVTGFFKGKEPLDYTFSELENVGLMLARKNLPANARFILHKPAGNKVLTDVGLQLWHEVRAYEPEHYQHWTNSPVRRNPAHQSDRIRFQVMADEGGLYLDTDVLLFKPLTEELQMSAFLVNEGDRKQAYNNGFMWADRPNHPFFTKVYNSANDLKPEQNRRYHSISRLLLERVHAELGERAELQVLTPASKYWNGGNYASGGGCMHFWSKNESLPGGKLEQAKCWHMAGTSSGRRICDTVRYKELMTFCYSLL